VTPWEMFKLNVSDKPATHQAQLGLEKEIEYGVGGEAISNRVFVGDNLVPCESDNGKVFWLFLCDKPKHIVKDTFTNAYKNTYYEGDEAIWGRWYDLLRPRSIHIFSMMTQNLLIYTHIGVCIEVCNATCFTQH
jgi:hypothetical protein